MIIRSTQLQILRESHREDFVRRMEHHLLKRYTLGASPDDTLRRRIEEAIDSGATYGIKRADDVRRYIEACVRFGWNFHQQECHQWARQILEMTCYDGTTKMDRIEDYELFVLKGRTGSMSWPIKG